MFTPQKYMVVSPVVGKPISKSKAMGGIVLNIIMVDRPARLNVENISYVSLYNLTKIKSLYSNPDTVSFWDIDNEIKLLEERGYSTGDMETRLQRSFAFPFYLLSMILLSGVFTLGVNFKENNVTYVFIAIMSSVLIYFFNDFSAVLGKTDRLPLEIAVWMPIAIIFIFSSVGIIHANQK